MSHETPVPTPREVIEASSATEAFKAAFLRFLESPMPVEGRIEYSRSPAVKVIRTICGLLEHAPEFPLDSVRIDAQSGCSDYRGKLIVNGGEKRFDFIWDCAWKAREAGMTDFMGFPDQGRAARQFGHRCFQRFEEVG